MNKDSIEQLEEDLLLVKNDVTRSILEKEIEVRKMIRQQLQSTPAPIGKSRFGIREINLKS